eukprot:TRINITY_DN2989_c0_g1_i1.p1 TRINITY_DN2989_c0_g1~~TRINITY_DN2989_c0_g1_i1.p1  ORF type:complete len:360 (+),score=56.29 TRINITY_DN2989_c0_g1_i1:1161-2240(+)
MAENDFVCYWRAYFGGQIIWLLLALGTSAVATVGTESLSPRSFEEQIMYAVVRLEVLFSDGTISFGTGFRYNPNTTDNSFIVTNKHVLKRRDGSLVNRITAHFRTAWHPGASLVQFEWTPKISGVIEHPDECVDIVAIPFASSSSVLWRDPKKGRHQIALNALDPSFIPTDLELHAYLTVGDRVSIIGFPGIEWDSSTNLPSLRGGYTAYPPYLNFTNSGISHTATCDGVASPSSAMGLLDIANEPGSSGSPIIWNRLKSSTKLPDGNNSFEDKYFFLGVIFGTRHRDEQKIQPIPTMVRNTGERQHNMREANVSIAYTNILNVGYFWKSVELLKMNFTRQVEIPFGEMIKNALHDELK